jgi:hypothetical protein
VVAVVEVDVPLGSVVPVVGGGTAAFADVDVREVVVEVIHEPGDPHAATKSPAPITPATHRTARRDGLGRC